MVMHMFKSRQKYQFTYYRTVPLLPQFSKIWEKPVRKYVHYFVSNSAVGQTEGQQTIIVLFGSSK